MAGGVARLVELAWAEERMQLGTAFEGCFGVRSEALIRSSYSAGGFSILDFNLTWDDNPYLLPICCLFVAYLLPVFTAPASLGHQPRQPCMQRGSCGLGTCRRPPARGRGHRDKAWLQLQCTNCSKQVVGVLIFSKVGGQVWLFVWLTFKKARRLEEKQLKLQSLHPNMFQQTCLPFHPCAHRKAACTQTPHGGSVRPPVLRCSTGSSDFTQHLLWQNCQVVFFPLANTGDSPVQPGYGLHNFLQTQGPTILSHFLVICWGCGCTSAACGLADRQQAPWRGWAVQSLLLFP